VPKHGEFEDCDRALLARAGGLLADLRRVMDGQSFNEGLELVWGVVRAANVYVDKQAPWKLKKENPARMNTVLYVLAETIRHLGILLQPFMPGSCARMLDQLAVSPGHRDFTYLGPGHALVPGTALPAPQGIFPRFRDDG